VLLDNADAVIDALCLLVQLACNQMTKPRITFRMSSSTKASAWIWFTWIVDGCAAEFRFPSFSIKIL
jgi:hypothetical protein